MKRLAVTALITLAIPVFAGCALIQPEKEPEDTALTPNATMTVPETSETTVPTPTSTPSPTPTPAPERINVSFIGDCTLADALSWSGSAGSFDAVVEEEGLEYCFQNAAPYLSQDDLTLANFEGTITEETSHLLKEFVFSGPPEYVEMLTNGSVEAVNLANNHSYDYYEQGLIDTQQAMDDAGILWSNQDSVAITDIRGIRIGMCGIDMVSGDTASTAYPLIDQLREEGCNIVIVSVHWGYERDYDPRDDQVTCGHDLIDYGADIVVGTHPHRLQPIEQYNGKYIIYCLSNFCFGGNTGLSDPDSCIVQCEFVMDETNTYCEQCNLNVIPFSQTSTRPGNDYCPEPYEWGTEDYYRVMDKLNWSQEDE